MRLLRLLGRTALGLVALAVLVYPVAVVINWRDEPPSVAASKLNRVIAERPSNAGR